jgi:hypothetical protein
MLLPFCMMISSCKSPPRIFHHVFGPLVEYTNFGLDVSVAVTAEGFCQWMLVHKEHNIPGIPVQKCALFCTGASPTAPSAIVAIRPSPFQNHTGAVHAHLTTPGPHSTASV